MRKWEYMCFQHNDLEHGSLEKWLNVRGDRGWELVTVLPTSKDWINTVFLKRGSSNGYY